MPHTFGLPLPATPHSLAFPSGARPQSIPLGFDAATTTELLSNASVARIHDIQSNDLSLVCSTMADSLGLLYCSSLLEFPRHPTPVAFQTFSYEYPCSLHASSINTIEKKWPQRLLLADGRAIKQTRCFCS